MGNHYLVVFDTNFLLVPAQFGVDIIGELHRLLDVHFEMAVPDVVLEELDVIERKSRGKDLLAVRMAKKLAERFNVVKIGRYGEKPTDELILEFAGNRKNVIVCTNDRGLRKKLRERGIPVVYLRQRKILLLEGMIT